MSQIEIKETRLIRQDWYETECTKVGWGSHGWSFYDTGELIECTGYDVVSILSSDKYGNPILGIAQKNQTIDL